MSEGPIPTDRPQSTTKHAILPPAPAATLPAVESPAVRLQNKALQSTARLQTAFLGNDGKCRIYGGLTGGVNLDIQRDVAQAGTDAIELVKLLEQATEQRDTVLSALSANAELLARFKAFLVENYGLHPETKKVFIEAEKSISDSLNIICPELKKLHHFATETLDYQEPHQRKAARDCLNEILKLPPAIRMAPDITSRFCAIAENLLLSKLQPKPGDFPAFSAQQTTEFKMFEYDAQRFAIYHQGLSSPGAEQIKESLSRCLLNLSLYYNYLTASSNPTEEVNRTFESLKQQLIKAIPQQHQKLADTLSSKSLTELSVFLRNSYSSQLDPVITDLTTRSRFYSVQSACVRLTGTWNGSGVNISPQGLILTNAHVADQLGAKWTVEFPDGRKYSGECIAIDPELDLALVRLEDCLNCLPWASLAEKQPKPGTNFFCIGSPRDEKWSIKSGRILEYLAEDPKGILAQMRHNAPCKYGNSGSPLLDNLGRIIGLHNSVERKSGDRHAIPLDGIRQFLRRFNSSLRW